MNGSIGMVIDKPYGQHLAHCGGFRAVATASSNILIKPKKQQKQAGNDA